jgi:hypothetical protein
MPLLALAYAMHFGGMQTSKNYMAVMEQLDVRLASSARRCAPG